MAGDRSSDDAVSVNVSSLNMQDATVKEVLDKVLSNSELEYSLKNGVLLLKKRPVEQEKIADEVVVTSQKQVKQNEYRDFMLLSV